MAQAEGCPAEAGAHSTAATRVGSIGGPITLRYETRALRQFHSTPDLSAVRSLGRDSPLGEDRDDAATFAVIPRADRDQSARPAPFIRAATMAAPARIRCQDERPQPVYGEPRDRGELPAIREDLACPCAVPVVGAAAAHAQRRMANERDRASRVTALLMCHTASRSWRAAAVMYRCRCTRSGRRAWCRHGRSVRRTRSRCRRRPGGGCARPRPASRA